MAEPTVIDKFVDTLAGEAKSELKGLTEISGNDTISATVGEYAAGMIDHHQAYKADKISKMVYETLIKNEGRLAKNKLRFSTATKALQAHHVIDATMKFAIEGLINYGVKKIL